MYIGRNEFLMNISLDVDDDKRAGDIESIIFQIKQDIREMYPEALYINIEISDSKNS
jgi:divalent metal cation (Fe/Co/Zn/Cd) transporter